MNDIEKGQLCKTTIQCLHSVNGSLSNFPGLLKKIIKTKAWERRTDHGKIVELESLRELISLEPIEGWGEDPKKVEALIKDDPEILTMYREAMKQKPGPKNDSSVYNIPRTEASKGTSKSRTLSRLKRESPELFVQVCDGELSANAAAIKAGFRKKTITVQIDPESAARTITKAFTKRQINKLIKILQSN